MEAAFVAFSSCFNEVPALASYICKDTKARVMAKPVFSACNR